MKTHVALMVFGIALLLCRADEPTVAAVDSLHFSGAADSNQASFQLTGKLRNANSADTEPRVIYAVHSKNHIQVSPKWMTETWEVRARVIQGKLREIGLTLRGDGEVTQATGDGLLDWGIRVGPSGKVLILRINDPGTNAPATNAVFAIQVRKTIEKLPCTLTPMHLTADGALFQEGLIEVVADELLELSATNVSGMTPVGMGAAGALETNRIQFHYSTEACLLDLNIQERDADARKVTWSDFALTGELGEGGAAFMLRGRATVRHPDGGVLEVLSGAAALTSLPEAGELKYEEGRYLLKFDKAGSYPLELKFSARVSVVEGWNTVHFTVAPSSLRPVVLNGLDVDTRFQIPGAAKPERRDGSFASFLPAAGPITLQWKKARAEDVGKLQYSAQSVSQATVSPGLLRQAHVIDFKVMQGELSQITLDVIGDGEVGRVIGENVLGWTVEEGKPRHLVVRLNQPCRDHYQLRIQTQNPLGDFPARFSPLKIIASQAIRHDGHLLIVNNGAVKLEVADSGGLSQISPELFPKSKELLELAGGQATQSFAYRFAGGDYSLSVQADNILPELAVSEVVLYHLGENEISIEAEMELDIREAPLREFDIRVPGDFTVSKVVMAQLADFNLAPDSDGKGARLKLSLSQPLTGRQIVQIRLEKNQNVVLGPWRLPLILPESAKSIRGSIGVSSDTGFRLVPGEIKGMSEIANAYFPRKVAGLQAAWRLREEAWDAVVSVERLAQSIQAEATHLFAVNDGVAYGSSIINYLVSGAPVSTLKVASNPEYANVEFTGRDIRSWKKTEAGYEVYLQSPIYGNYTLLATYDCQFGARSNEISFAGMRASDAQAEQGTVLLVSEQPLQVKTVVISSGLLPLEPGEIPPEQRLFFDAPILAAYQYSARPFDLKMSLDSLEPGKTARQVVDRATLDTQVSRQGEVVTAARYYVKSQGYSHLQVALPPDSRLWEAKVDGARVVPVSDKADTLIPLPRQSDSEAALCVELNMASTSAIPSQVFLKMPALSVPVILTEWTVNPDENYRLTCLENSAGIRAQAQSNGFDWFGMAWRHIPRAQCLLTLVPALLLAGILCFRISSRPGARRWTIKHTIGAALGAICSAGAVLGLIALGVLSLRHPVVSPGGIEVSAPIQQVGQSLQMHVNNVEASSAAVSWAGWPAVLGLALWAFLLVRGSQWTSAWLGWQAGWALLCWGALRSANGVPVFLGLIVAFLVVQVLWPLFQSQLRLPPKPKSQTTGATTVALLILGGLLGATPVQAGVPPVLVAQSLTQEIRVQDGYAFVTGRLTWQAESGQFIDFLTSPAVLIRCQPDQASVKLGERRVDGESVYSLVATEKGRFEATFEYQISVKKWSPSSSVLLLPTPSSIVNRVQIQFPGQDVEVSSTNAVSIATVQSRENNRDATRTDLVLMASAQPLIKWSPRSRDPRSEKPVYYAELRHVLIPTAGLVEGIHDVQIRLAQGQLAELNFNIPNAMTITDVQSPLVSSWRLDASPEPAGTGTALPQRILRVQLTAPQSKPFSLRLSSQQGSRPLPYEQTNQVISLAQAAGQVGLVAVMTGSEVQLDSAKENGMSAINLEDFPGGLVEEGRIPGLAIRRAYRYSEGSASLILAASAVQPDVRVETQQTLSLGEDRSVLASQLSVHILRAGIFKLSFVLPQDFEVESLTGSALSHWTENATGSNRVVTLNLRGKTDGDQTFNISLAGPGLVRRTQWEAPRLALREAAKQTGQLVLAPEPGVRLHVSQPDGVSQLDPKKAGIQQKGVLAFHLLRPDWRLPFEIETVEPWIQCSLLQDVTVRESQLLVSVQMDYQIENAGVKSLLIDIPENAENARFDGDLISDSVRVPGATGGRACWNVKLQRRVLGDYSLRLTYQVAATNAASSIIGVKSHDANLRHAWLAVHSDGRLQIQFPSVPASLQSADWQSIPAPLRRLKQMVQSKDAFAVLEPDFELPFQRTRHEAARVLPARVDSLELESVIAESGEVLTEASLSLHPGDKRLLTLKLPPGASFWHASVNGYSAWPWRDGEKIVLLLEKNSNPDAATIVNFTYASSVGGLDERQLKGPLFDLPLENITWTLNAPADWDLNRIQSSLQLASPSTNFVRPMPMDHYLEEERARMDQRTEQAGELLQMGNSFLAKGTPYQARRAYQSAWKLSTQDPAMNEDARVQLHNLKMQQALLGLNQRRQSAFETFDKSASPAARNPFARLLPGQTPDYTQDQAREMLEGNGTDENSALMRLAERLIRQQDETVGKPGAIHSTLPRIGRQLVFKGSLQVSEWADLDIQFHVARGHSHGVARQWGFVFGLFGVLILLAGLARSKQKPA